MPEYNKDGKLIVYRAGVYYRVENDERLHTDNDMIMRLQKLIPNYWDDICPLCGEKCHIACKCPENHRTCDCGVQWHWTVDKRRAVVAVVIDKLDN